MDANSTATLKIPKITWWIIWGALSSSIVLYVVILQIMGGAEKPDAAAVKNGIDLKNILLPIAIVAVVVSFSIRFLLTTRLAKSRDDRKRAQSFSTYIVSLALADSAAVYGLVLGMQGAPMNDYGTFLVIGFLAMILQPPTVLFPSKEGDYLDKLRRG